MALHDEQGISATSVRDVAGRAGVSASTVLQHFPRMGDLISACGELSGDLAPMPHVGLLAGASNETERIERMATAMFEWWELLGPGFDHMRTDRRRIPDVDAWLVDVGRRHRELAAAAVADPSRVDLLVALTTADAWQTLRGPGSDPRLAGVRVARLIGPERSVHISKERLH